MLQFGMPTLIETKTVAQAAALCRELGLSFLELNTNFPMQQPNLLCPQELTSLAKEYGIFYTIHLNDELTVADFNPHVAQGYRRSALDAIELAKKIGADTLNMHLSKGARYTMPDRKVFFYEVYLEQYLTKMAEFRDICEEAIGGSGIRICVENCNGYMDFQKKAIEILLESPAFGLTLDIGHSYCAGRVDEPLILAREGRLCHMHMHDARDGCKDHLALGNGEIDIPKYLELADRCGCTVVLETKTVAGLRQSAQWIRDHWL